jgi:hypothetical protein
MLWGLNAETHHYHVSSNDGRFEVVDPAGRNILVCRDEPSATHYTVLLNEAYQRGYKAGYRDARRAVD